MVPRIPDGLSWWCPDQGEGAQHADDHPAQGNGQIVADLVFTAFDKDKDGWIDFNEFIIATHCTATSSPKDKLHWVFQMYDTDKSQTIQLGEMVELFGTLYINEGLEKDLAVDRAMAIFSTLDVNNDGDVTEEEFVRGWLDDEDLVNALSDKSSDHPLVVQTPPRVAWQA